uniref:class D sortase n=1 Tax=Rubrobacter tropicus TaxID=2653851 RepID=UPI001409AF08|nr:class D sortase [Rubrobacter tropicus]
MWFEPGARKWAIFNQDLAPVPGGATFQVVIPPEPERFVHRSTPDNTSESGTYLDDPLVNGKPDARLSVTQNWNPGGGGGVYNDREVGFRYDKEREAWEIYNEDGSAIPEGASFNVGVLKVASAVNVETAGADGVEAPEYRDFYSEGDPKPPKLISSDSSAGAIPVVTPFNFGRNPGGPKDKTLSIDIPKIGLEGVPAFDTVSEEKLRDGTVHIPASGYPWQDGANVFIAGHRIGYPGTPSDYVFFRLDELEEGDEIRLTDAAGREFLYRVTKRTVVGPNDVGVMNAVEGKSLVTLQTCTLPDYEDRLIVQGELVESQT